MTIILDKLSNSEISESISAISSPEAIRDLLTGNPYIDAVRQSIGLGNTTDDQIKTWISGLLIDLERGVHFKHESSFIALCRVLESLPTVTAGNILKDLSQLNIKEIQLASRVAKVCLNHKYKNMISSSFSFKSIPVEYVRQEASLDTKRNPIDTTFDIRSVAA